MPISISVQTNRILLKIQKGSPAFRIIVDTVKKFHCTYDPDTHEWEIPPKKFEQVNEALSDIDRVALSVDDEKKIDQLINVPTQIKRSYTPIVVSNLKAPPIKGKPPFENFQLIDVNSCYNTNRYGLFNEQGTGKSYILISTIDKLRQNKGVKKVLFITSASGVYNIKKEFSRFSNISEDKIAIGGIKNRRPFDDTNIDVVICNYRSFLLISDEYQKDKDAKIKNYRNTPIPMASWLAGDQGVLVLDESHLISNPKARQTKVIHLVADFFEYRYLATGTPADKPWKYYSQLKILDPALVKDLSYYEWLAEYYSIGNRFSNYAINYLKSYKVEELTNIVKSICVRRFADDVLSLPEQYVRKHYVEFTDIQREIYRSLVLNRMDAIQSEFGRLDSRAVANSFPYLILAIDNPELLLSHSEKLEETTIIERVNRFNFMKDHSKIEAVVDIVENHPNEKTVIWTSSQGIDP
jgi:SNF2 family DNA or RNA helicase